MPAATARVGGRVGFVDATRGLAMGLVCLSHFGIFYFGSAGALRAENIVAHLVAPATPTFMLLSGVVLGMLFRRPGARIDALTNKMIDRGLFLLGPGHVLIWVGHVQAIAAAPRTAHWLFITDPIGVSLIVGACLLPRTRSATRVLSGASLLLACWLVYLRWLPRPGYALLLKDYLVGEPQSPSSGVVFPILPWLAFYLMATAVGEQIARLNAEGHEKMARYLTKLGAPLVLIGGALDLVRRATPLPALRALASAVQKYPPGPNYLLFFSGIALLLLAVLAWLERRGRFQRVMGLFAVVGRASLVVYVVQYFVYYWGFFLLRLPMSRLWPLYFALSLAINFGAAWLWERYFGNQWLTVGWPWWRRIFPRPKAKARGWLAPRISVERTR